MAGSTPVDFDYNDYGNLTHKSDISSLGASSMAYAKTGNAGLHAVTSLNTGSTTHNFAYDANGNLTSGDALGSSRSIVWTSYDKPSTITQGAITRSFAYGPDRARYRQTHDDGSSTTTYTYIGDYYTKEDYGSGVVDHKLTVFAGGQAIAIMVDDQNTTANAKEARYLHRDHLGSITSIVDSGGIEALSYDVFGKRRDASDWVGSAAAPSEERGYTGHEHLDDVNLIHMNGRIYDPVIARFASADPVLQAPLNSQNYNRYGYVLNNPLGYTDPSGYMSKEVYVGQIPITISDPITVAIQTIKSVTSSAKSLFDFIFGGSGSDSGEINSHGLTQADLYYASLMNNQMARDQQAGVNDAMNAYHQSYTMAMSIWCANDPACSSQSQGLYQPPASTIPYGHNGGGAGFGAVSDYSADTMRVAVHGAQKRPSCFFICSAKAAEITSVDALDPRSIFNVEASSASLRDEIYGYLGDILRTKRGRSSYLTWRESNPGAGPILVDMTCFKCSEYNAVAYTTSGSQFEVHLPPSLKTWYYGILSSPQATYTVEITDIRWALTHEVFGHGFGGLSNSRHSNVIQMTNSIMKELDPDYEFESSEFGVCRRHECRD